MLVLYQFGSKCYIQWDQVDTKWVPNSIQMLSFAWSGSYVVGKIPDLGENYPPFQLVYQKRKNLVLANFPAEIQNPIRLTFLPHLVFRIGMQAQ